MKPQAPEALAAFIGLDWADATHAICRQAAGSERRAFLVLEHRPEAIDAGVQTLRPRFRGHPVAGCRELHQGPLVSAQRHDDGLVRCPIHPFTLATSREALTPSRAQDHPTEAELQVERRLKHRDTLTPLTPQRPTRRALAPLVDHRRRRVGDHVRGTQRLTSVLTNDCPPVLPWFQENETGIVCDFLSRWPTLNAAPRARRITLEPFFREHHGRSADVIKTRIEALKSAVALTTDTGVITPHALVVHALVAPLRVTLPASTDVDHAIADHAQGHPDVPVFDALPGAGAVFAPRRLVAFGEPRARYASAEERPKDAGIAPVTARRGKKPGCTGASSGRSSCDPRWWRGPPHRAATPAGRQPPPSSHVIRARHTRLPYGL